MLFAFVVIGLVSSVRLQNVLFCVEWHVNLKSMNDITRKVLVKQRKRYTKPLQLHYDSNLQLISCDKTMHVARNISCVNGAQEKSMYYEPQSGMYFSYDAATETHQYHSCVSATKFAQLSHIIYNRSHRAADTQAHKVRFTYLSLQLVYTGY